MSHFDSEQAHTKYREVALDDDEKPLRLADADDEEYSQAAELYQLRRSLQRTNLYLKCIIGVFSAIFAFWLIVHVTSSYRRYTMIGTPLLKTPVPHIPTRVVTFEEDKLFSSRPNATTDAAWDSLLYNGRGFVFVDNPQKDYDLPDGQDTPHGQIYSVALYHQIHCLGELRRFTWMFLDAIVDQDQKKQDEILEMSYRKVHLEHLNHCFDYLRQTIFCGGDMSMEWPRTEENGERIAVDGWGIPHECKDMRAIEDYMAKNHFNESTNDQIAPHRR